MTTRLYAVSIYREGHGWTTLSPATPDGDAALTWADRVARREAVSDCPADEVAVVSAESTRDLQWPQQMIEQTVWARQPSGR